MYKKICPYCKGDSYSAALGKWICPYCNFDMTIILPEPSAWAANETRHGELIPQERKVISIYEKLNSRV